MVRPGDGLGSIARRCCVEKRFVDEGDLRMEASRDPGDRVRAAVHALIVVVAGVCGMVGYGLIVGKPLTRWPLGDAAVMTATTLICAGFVHSVTERLLARERRHA